MISQQKLLFIQNIYNTQLIKLSLFFNKLKKSNQKILFFQYIVCTPHSYFLGTRIAFEGKVEKPENQPQKWHICSPTDDEVRLIRLDLILQRKELFKEFHTKIFDQLNNIQSFIHFINYLNKDIKPVEREYRGLFRLIFNSVPSDDIKKDQKFLDQVFQVYEVIAQDFQFVINQKDQLQEIHKNLKQFKDHIDLFNIGAPQLHIQIDQDKLDVLNKCKLDTKKEENSKKDQQDEYGKSKIQQKIQNRMKNDISSQKGKLKNRRNHKK